MKRWCSVVAVLLVLMVGSAQAAEWNLYFGGPNGAFGVWQIDGTTVTDTSLIGNFNPSCSAQVIGEGTVNANPAYFETSFWNCPNSTQAAWEDYGYGYGEMYGVNLPAHQGVIVAAALWPGETWSRSIWLMPDYSLLTTEYSDYMLNEIRTAVNVDLNEGDWPVAAADLDGNGYPDYLTRDIAGVMNVYYMGSGGLMDVVYIGTVIGSDWDVIGLVDIDGSGTYDILWFNYVTRVIAAWEVSSWSTFGVSSYPTIGQVAQGWYAVGGIHRHIP